MIKFKNELKEFRLEELGRKFDDNKLLDYKKIFDN